MFFVITGYFTLIFYSLYLRYENFAMLEPTDSAAYMQVSWSTLHWPPFTISLQENLISYFPFNFLGDQLMWTLALFSPLCLLPCPGVMFLAAQSTIICSGAFLLYLIAAEKLENRLVALLLTTCYLFNPATYLSFSYFGFRAETLFIPLTFLIFYLVDKSKPAWACLVLALFLLTKHNSILIAVPLGAYFVFWDRKQWRFGIFCILSSIVYYVVGLKIIMASLQENPVAHFKHFAQFGGTPWEVTATIIAHPGKIFSLIGPLKLDYVLRMIFPAGLLALFSPIFWICSSELLINAVIGDYVAVDCGWHWTFVIPFMFLGMIFTMCWLFGKTNRHKHIRKALTILLLFQMTLELQEVGYRIYSDIISFHARSLQNNSSQIMHHLSSIDHDASIMVSAQLLWSFFDRRHIYNARVKFHDEVDYIAILLPSDRPAYTGLDLHIDHFLIKELTLQSRTGESKFRNFDIIVNDSNLLVYKHK